MKLTRRTTALLLLLALALPLARAQQPATNDEPNAERLRAHVNYLASDKLEGRRTGTPGAEAAARYVADEFKRLGLRPGIGGQPAAAAGHKTLAWQFNNYYQPFPYVAAVELGKRNAMKFVPRMSDRANIADAPALDLRLGEDWMPLAWSANTLGMPTPVVYVGYGITASELQHDDYAGVEVKDKIALAFVGTPDGDNPHGQFVRYNDLRFKAAAARDHGARALLLITHEENFKDDKFARLHLDDNAAGDAGLPVAIISRQVARRAVEASATPAARFEDLESALNAQPGQQQTGAPQPPAQPTAAPSAQTNTPTPTQAARKSFSAPLKNIAFSVATDLVHREAPAANVVGVLEGRDAKLKDEVIVIGAHYDHLGRGGAGSLAPREGEIHHGADDNASGTAGLLELARLFTAARPRRTVVFIAFSGEEEGLLGSAYYVAHPVFPLAQTVAMFNMDMIGRLKEDKLNVGGVGTAAEWRDLVTRNNRALGVRVSATGVTVTSDGAAHGEVPMVTSADGRVIAAAAPHERFTLAISEDGYGPSDHSSFYAKQVPVLFFWTGTHEDYHKPSDTPDKINYEGEARVVALVRDMVRAVDADDKRPTYTQARSDNAQGRTGFRVYLGTIPSYADSTDGLKLDGVRDDSPAAKAGLKAGDKIVKLAGRDVRNVYDYTYALGEMKAGQEYAVEVIRGTERLTLKITPAARK
jgi:aminopeptidase YwaD